MANKLSGKEIKADPLNTESKFKALAEKANDGILVAVGKGVHVYANEKASQIVGYSIPELLDMGFWELSHPDELNKIRERYKKRIKGEYISNAYETVLVRKDGKSVPIELTGVKTCWDGQTADMVIIRDLSNLSQTEQALRESETRFKELAELLPQTVYEMDINGNLTFVNRRAFDQFGYTIEDFNKGANAFDMIITEDHNRAIENIAKLLRGEKIGINKYTALRKDKSTFPAKFYSEGIFRGGKPFGVRGLIIDITEQEMFEKELQKARDELENRVKERTSALTEANEILRAEIAERKRIEIALLAKEKELENKNDELNEFNSALKVLLKKRDEDKIQLEDKVISNVKELILPYLEQLKKDALNSRHSAYLNIIESNLKDIISSFGANIKKRFLNLTPTEIRIADLIKNGKTTKEIASLLSLSQKTIEFHRDNIRSKLQIKNKKINLRAYLLSLH